MEALLCEDPKAQKKKKKVAAKKEAKTQKVSLLDAQFCCRLACCGCSVLLPLYSASAGC
jgi:hypothetical protein